MSKITFFGILFLLLITFSYCGEDYYKLLGLKRGATKEQIKRAFKKLSLKYHPDKNRDNPKKAKEMFVKIANAYDVLSNDTKREIYDKYGEEGVKANEQGGNPGGAHFENMNFEDIINRFFGMGMGAGRGQRFSSRMGGGGGKSGGFGFEDLFSGFRQNGRGRQQQQGRRQSQGMQNKNYFANTKVTPLKMKNLTFLLSRKNIWFVYFYKAGDQNFEQYVNAMKEFSSKTDGLFNSGSVNCVADEEICDEYDVKRTPSIVFFSENQKEYNKYGGKIEFNALFNYAVNRMSYYVHEVTKDNLNDFYSKRKEKYHVLLFTSKNKTPSMYKALSKYFINKLVFGEVKQEEKELIQMYKVTEFPTLMIVLDEEKNNINLYKGKTTYEDIQRFLNRYISKEKEVENTKVKEMNDNMYNNLNMCSNKDGKNICLIYFTNLRKPIKRDRDILEDVGIKYENDHVKVFFVNMKKNPKIFEAFEDLDENSCQAVIIKGKRRKYLSLNKEEFRRNINNMVDNIISGGGEFKKLKGELRFGGEFTSDL